MVVMIIVTHSGSLLSLEFVSGDTPECAKGGFLGNLEGKLEGKQWSLPSLEARRYWSE